MSQKREEFVFPTRQYPYRKRTTASDQPDPALLAEIQSGAIYRFVLGLDTGPKVMESAEADELLGDPFAELLLRRGTLPATGRDLLAAIDAFSELPEGLPRQRSFLIAEGGQILWSAATANVNRSFRLAVTREGAGDRFLLISMSTALDSPDQFLQVLSWDERNAVYHYYERRHGSWMWAGNSKHALEPKTRGRGPFDSHVNGSLVMKELRPPWVHWHSMDASIPDDVLEPRDPLRNEPVFKNRQSAHDFEKLVRSRIALWNKARLTHYRVGDKLVDVEYLMRQVLTTTTVNLITTMRESRLVTDDEDLSLPNTFFLNTDVLLDLVKLPVEPPPIVVKGKLYRDSLKKYEFRLVDGDHASGQINFQQDGDTHFAFLVPEPAFEDTNVIALLIREKLVSKKFIACLLMIDFQNPVSSRRRAKLMQSIPTTAVIASDTDPKTDIEAKFVAALTEAGVEQGSPEAEFLDNWNLSGWEQAFAKRIADYFEALKTAAATASGFDGWVQLAESRRREFRKKPLAEFSLTLPVTNIPFDSPPLEMNTDGTVSPKQ